MEWEEAYVYPVTPDLSYQPGSKNKRGQAYAEQEPENDQECIGCWSAAERTTEYELLDCGIPYQRGNAEDKKPDPNLLKPLLFTESWRGLTFSVHDFLAFLIRFILEMMRLPAALTTIKQEPFSLMILNRKTSLLFFFWLESDPIKGIDDTCCYISQMRIDSL